MKDLKKLSLKEEVDREAERLEKEVKDRRDLDDITVSEKMETSLFNKIQDYEYDKRSKKVYRKKKKRYVVMALAAVFILAFGSVMTSVGSKSYWKVLWDRIAGDERASHIDVEQMESQETQDVDEIQVYKEIWNELGISTVGLGYIPENTYLKKYELDKEQRKAILLYEYNGQVIRYTMYKLLDEYQVETTEGKILEIKEYEIAGTKTQRYMANFEYDDAQYQIMADIKKEEFEKIVKNLIFL